MERQRLLAAILIFLVIVIGIIATLFFHELVTARGAVTADREREAPIVGGKISITILNETEGGLVDEQPA